MNAGIGRPARAALLIFAVVIGGCSGKPAVKSAAAVPAEPPQWSGVWIAGGMEMNVDGYTPVDPKAMAGPLPEIFIFSPTTPWNDEARKKVQAVMAATHGDPGSAQPRGAGGWGYPLMMMGPAPLQFSVTPGATLMWNQYRDMRQIYTDGRGHQPAEEGWPSTTWGDSIGHWEGDTLVIDTTGVRNPSLYFGIAAPFSEKAHYIEHLRLAAPDRIEGDMTVEDPDMLTRPLQIKLSFVRSKEVERMVLDSFSNDRTGLEGQVNTIEAAKE